MRTRLLGLAVLAALAVTALVGAGSASALTLCKVNTNPCPEESRYPAETTIKGKSTSTLKMETLTVACVDTKVEIKTLAESGSPLLAELTFPTFTECFDNATECAQEVLLTPYEAFFYEPGGGNGKLAPYEEPGERFAMKVQCGSLTCVYEGGMKFEITGWGARPKMTISFWEPTLQSGPGCASTATWKVNYTLGTPSPLYIQESP